MMVVPLFRSTSIDRRVSLSSLPFPQIHPSEQSGALRCPPFKTTQPACSLVIPSPRPPRHATSKTDSQFLAMVRLSRARRSAVENLWGGRRGNAQRLSVYLRSDDANDEFLRECNSREWECYLYVPFLFIASSEVWLVHGEFSSHQIRQAPS